MKNHYAAGFYGLLAALIIIVCAVFYATFTDGRVESTDKAYGFINAVSALIQAIAAVLVAGLAFKGWNSWKLQIIHGKALGIVWDANVAFREIEASVNALRARWIRSYDQGLDLKSEIESSGSVGKALEKFKGHCILLDKVVVKNDWEWQNRATELKQQIFQLAVEQAKPVRHQGASLISLIRSKTDDSVAEKSASLQAAIDSIGAKLEALESKYLS